jgi:ribosomal protein S18 acetylase RimI-like enzyme
MNDKLNVRKATEKDLDAIGTLWKELMDFHKVLDSLFTRSPDGHVNFINFIKGQISSEVSCVLVGEHHNNIVAYCFATVADYPPVFEEKQYGTIFDMAVSEHYRRSGIGERMFKVIQDWFKQKDINRIELRVALSNELSTNFWRKMGFKPYLETVVKKIG